MDTSEVQTKVSQPEVVSPASTSSVPQMWNNLIRWCNSDMQNHMKKINARPHECKTCGKRFTLLENLNRHQMIHTNQRPFHCPYCSKSFRLSQHLKEHIRIHTGEKPYKCHICGHAFCQISNLKSHQKTHTKVKGFRCDQCGKEFRRSFTLKQHKLTHNKTSKSESKATATTKPVETSRIGSETPAGSEAVTVMATSSTSESNTNLQNGVVTSSNNASLSTATTGTLLYQNLMTNSSTEQSNVITQDKEKKSVQLLSLWNALNLNKRSENVEKTKVALPKFTDPFQLSGVTHTTSDTNTCSRISKYVAFASSNALNQLLPNEKKSADGENSLHVLPSDSWFHKKTSNQISMDMPASKETSKATVMSSTALKVASQNDVIVSTSNYVTEKTSDENSTRKRKQTQSLYEPIVSCSSFLDGLSTKNNQFFPRTRPFKSLTISQDYNWKRQLCREWQQTDRQYWVHDNRVPGRSNSADLSRDAIQDSTFSSSFGSDKLLAQNSYIKSETKDANSQHSLSLDDDVFSPLITKSLPTPRDLSKTSLPLSDDARSNLILQNQRGIFQYPDIPPARKVRHFTESSNDSSISKASSNLKPRRELNSIDRPASSFGTSSIPPLFFSPGKLHTQKTGSPIFQNSNPLYDFSSPCFVDPLLNSKLPLNPDFKALASSLSFVPLVTWKPVVTGWRNVLDGNVYPARMGVDNLNPFTLQQQIS